MQPNTTTNNSALAYEHVGNHLLEYFSKAGSFRDAAAAYYNNATDALELFKNAWRTGQYETCMKLLFWTRDCRGGAGARKNFRDIIKWLANEAPEWVKANIHLIPLYGRWDDLKSLYETPCEKDALNLWMEGVTSMDSSISHLAAKWADRRDIKLRKTLYLTPKAYRKLLVNKTKWVVEHDMCSGKWDKIPYSKVPSVAMSRLNKAFQRHDESRFNQYTQDVAANKTKINTAVLFPHDVVRNAKALIYDASESNIDLINSTFEKLPNYITNPNIRIMPICDFSGSMDIRVSGSITASDISLALGLYCSDKLGKDNPFYRKLIPFSDHSKLESWHNKSVYKAICDIPNGYCGSTNIQSALNNLLDSAIMWNVKPEQMVNTLIILSDMQFDMGVDDYDQTAIDQCINQWVKAGYEKPRIIYWNLVGYDNQPARHNDNNVVLVSGFSPAMLKTILAEGFIDPYKAMRDTIKKYNIITP